MLISGILLRARNVLAIALVILAVGLITACGSSGGGGVPAPADPPAGDDNPPATTISGTVTAPGGMVAMLEPQSLHYALLEAVLPAARADIIGLQPVGGATVELIRVDNNGVQVGDVLASTTTSTTGDYTLELPSGVSLAGDLIVRITGNGATLSAQVVDQVVDINPITDFILDKFIAGGTQLDTLAIGEVVRLTGRAAEFDLTAGADLTEMLAALEAEVGGFMEDEVAAVNATPGDGSGVVGTYNSGLFTIGLSNDDFMDGSGIRDGIFSTGFGRAVISIADAGNGALTATLISEEESDAGLSINNNVPPNFFLFSDTFIDIDMDVFPLTIDDNNVIRGSEPFEEEIITEANGGGPGGFGIRIPPGTLEVVPAGPDNDLFVLNSTFTEVRFGLTDTTGDGVNDALDPAAQRGTSVFIDMEFLARVPDPGSIPNVDGPWGFVTIEITLSDNGNIFAGVCLDENTIAGAVMSNSQSTCQDVNRAPGAAGGLVFTPDSVVIDPVTFTGPDANGEVSIMEEGDMTATEGFVDADGDFMALFFNEDIGAGQVLTETTRDALFGVPLGSTTPNLTGRSYRLMSQEIEFGANGSIAISRVSGATLTFGSNTDATLSPHSLRSAVRASDSDGPTSVNEESANAETAFVTLAANGAIVITLADGTVIDGFVSKDLNLLMMRVTFADTNGLNLGLVVGVPVPAAPAP